MTILGIDPGYDRVGWAVLTVNSSRTYSVTAYDCIQTNKSDDIWQRYSQIAVDLRKVIATHSPDVAAIESIFFSKNQKTAIKVSEARGIIIGCILSDVREIAEYTPNQIKLAVTGYGNSDKTAVEKMVRMQLKITNKKVIDDTMDAIATAFTHALNSGSRL